MNDFLLTFVLGFSLIACTHRNAESEINSSNIEQSQDSQARRGQGNMPKMRQMQDMMMSPEMHENMATMHQK